MCVIIARGSGDGGDGGGGGGGDGGGRRDGDGDGESWMNGWSMWWLADDPIDNPTG